MLCFFPLVVVLRFVIDLEQRAQRQHLVLTQQVDVVADRQPELDL